MKKLYLFCFVAIIFATSCTNGSGEGPGNRRETQPDTTINKIDSLKGNADSTLVSNYDDD